MLHITSAQDHRQPRIVHDTHAPSPWRTRPYPPELAIAEALADSLRRPVDLIEARRERQLEEALRTLTRMQARADAAHEGVSTRLGSLVAACDKWDVESDARHNVRGGNPKNKGQFSKASGSGGAAPEQAAPQKKPTETAAKKAPAAKPVAGKVPSESLRKELRHASNELRVALGKYTDIRSSRTLSPAKKLKLQAEALEKCKEVQSHLSDLYGTHGAEAQHAAIEKTRASMATSPTAKTELAKLKGKPLEELLKARKSRFEDTDEMEHGERNAYLKKLDRMIDEKIPQTPLAEARKLAHNVDLEAVLRGMTQPELAATVRNWGGGDEDDEYSLAARAVHLLKGEKPKPYLGGGDKFHPRRRDDARADAARRAMRQDTLRRLDAITTLLDANSHYAGVMGYWPSADAEARRSPR